MARNKTTPQDELNKQAVANNINKLLQQTNRKQIDIHNATGIPKSTITGYIKATSLPNAGNLQKIADFFGVAKSEIDPRFKSINSIHSVVNELVKIPILGEIACGEPITAIENVDDYKLSPSEGLPQGTVFYLRAKGDSMAPRIQSGDLVLIKEQPEVENGQIAAVLVNGNTEATLKRIKRQGDIVMLMPDNPDYEPFIITKENPARILGLAIEVVSKL